MVLMNKPNWILFVSAHTQTNEIFKVATWLAATGMMIISHKQKPTIALHVSNRFHLINICANKVRHSTGLSCLPKY